MNNPSSSNPARSADQAARRYENVRFLIPVSIGVASVAWAGWYAVGMRALPWTHQGNTAPAWIGLGLLAIALGLSLWRLVLASRYRPLPAPGEDDLPLLTVVVPAFNEGKQVLETLVSLAGSQYPMTKLQIIAVDDGSQDDTWAWMRRAARQLGGRIELVRLQDNRGKRHALAAGFAKATGRVLVTIDSDSEVRPDALANIAAPFVADPRVGAVAGNIRVMSRQKGLIAQMLDASFTYSFELIRAGQSTLGAVLCTPGAAAAYRSDLVLGFLDEWVEQRFLGQPANIGEDRALTNLVLRSGFDVVFQSTAVVETTTPESYGGLSRMLLRWARSDLRESLALLSFIFQPVRSDRLVGIRVLAIHGGFKLIATAAGFIGLLASAVFAPALTLAALLIGTALATILPACAYRLLRGEGGTWRTWLHALASTFVLSWITPWSLITPRKNGWLTRTLPAKPIPHRTRIPSVVER